MLVIKSIEDLKKYLETRRTFAERQADKNPKDQNARGQYYAFTESINAVEALARELQPVPAPDNSETS